MNRKIVHKHSQFEQHNIHMCYLSLQVRNKRNDRSGCENEPIYMNSNTLYSPIVSSIPLVFM